MMKNELARFGRGFAYAWHGILKAIREERNFRFHLCAAVYVYTAAAMAGFDRMRIALLSLCVFAVMGMELMNSAVERAVHKPDTTHWWSAGAAKDMAAGAVLAVALGAACVGVCLFGEPAVLLRLWQKATGNIVIIVLLLASLPAAYLFIFRLGNITKKDGTTDAGTPTQPPYPTNEP